jgi:hypothetical protein
LTGNEHGLGSFLAGTALGTNVVGWSQFELATIPEGSVIAGVVVGVAAEDVEYKSAEEFAQGLAGLSKSVADDFRQIFVTGMRAPPMELPWNSA